MPYYERCPECGEEETGMVHVRCWVRRAKRAERTLEIIGLVTDGREFALPLELRYDKTNGLTSGTQYSVSTSDLVGWAIKQAESEEGERDG